MPIDTEQWRASIGFFYASQVPLPSTKCNRPKTEFCLMFDVLMAIALLPLRAAAFGAFQFFVLLSSLVSYMPRLLSSLAQSSYHNLSGGIRILLALCLVVRMLLIMAGDVETNPGPPKIEATHHSLTLPGLLKFPIPQGKAINIPQQIGTEYQIFGIFLLDDHTGSIVDKIVIRHSHNSRGINIDILQKWIRGEGRKPISWETLTDCLKDSGLSELAEVILDTLEGDEEDILGVDDLFDIKCYLLHIDKTQIYNLGLALGLNYHKLKALERSHTFLDDMLATWLHREDNVMKRGVPSWRTLVWALEHQLVRQLRIASDICRDKGIEDDGQDNRPGVIEPPVRTGTATLGVQLKPDTQRSMAEGMPAVVSHHEEDEQGMPCQSESGQVPQIVEHPQSVENISSGQSAVFSVPGQRADTWEYRVFTKNSVDIISSLATVKLSRRVADELHSAGIIGKNVTELAYNTGPGILEHDRVRPMIKALEDKIQQNPEKYHEFRSILQTFGADAETAIHYMPEKANPHMPIAPPHEPQELQLEVHQYQQVAKTRMSPEEMHLVPVITAEPKSLQNITPGRPAAFLVKATGKNLTYTWHHQTTKQSRPSDKKVVGNTPTLQIDKVEPTDVGYYVCTISNLTGGTAETKPVELTTTTTIEEQPKHQLNIAPGSDASFTVKAEGMNLSYTWYYQSTQTPSPDDTVVGQNKSTLHISSVQMEDEGYYACKISSPISESVRTSPARLTMIPQIVEHPQSVKNIASGKSAVFTVRASGNYERYTWYQLTDTGITNALSENTSTLTIENVQSSDEGQYVCKVTNPTHGFVETKPAQLTLGPLWKEHKGSISLIVIALIVGSLGVWTVWESDIVTKTHMQHTTERGCFRGVDVIGETSINFSATDETQSFYWKGYGLKFHIPPASLPDGVKHSSVKIEASLAGQYKFPDGTTLVSAVYWMKSPLKFLQPITLEIQHCAKQSNGSTLSFAMAKHTQEDGPYSFKPLQGGLFISSYSYGSITLKHFCGIAIINNHTKEQSYCGRLFYYGNNADWKISFVIVQDLEAAINRVDKDYKNQITGPKQYIDFEKDNITLELNEAEIIKGWRLRPVTPPTILKSNVDSYESGRMIPSCLLRLKWIPKSQEPEELSHTVTLQGAKHPYDFITIESDPIPQNPQKAQDQGLRHYHVVAKDVIPTPAEFDRFPKPTLLDLKRHLTSVAAHWKSIGEGLKIENGHLDSIEANNAGKQNQQELCLARVFKTWHDQATVDFSWKSLVEVLLYEHIELRKTVKDLYDKL